MFMWNRLHEKSYIFKEFIKDFSSYLFLLLVRKISNLIKLS